MMTAKMDERQYERLYIGGEWTPSRSGRSIRSIDPSTEEVWAEVAEAGEADIDAAVAAARSAMQGVWKTRMTPSQRGELLLRLGNLIRRDAAKLAEIESRDNGKPLRDTLGEMQRAVVTLRMLDEIDGEDVAATLGITPGHVSVLLHRAKANLLACMTNETERNAS